MKTTMGIDQYGKTYHDLGKHPRKALLSRLSATHAEKMYVDRKDEPVHVGYVINKLLIKLYNVTHWRS